MNAAYLAARRAGKGAFPMLTVDWTGFRDYALGSARYAPQTAALPSGGALGVVPPGGFGPIRYGPGIKEHTLHAVTTSVKVYDEGRELVEELESYDPRGSAATIHWVVPDLVPADWELLFKGIVSDWKVVGDFVELFLKTDDSVLFSNCPRPVFNRSEWATSADPSIYETAMPLVMGYHNNFALTARGMLTAINIRYDDLLGFWWCASLGNLKAVTRLYFDSEEQTLFTVRRGVYGGALQTIIVVDPSIKPDKNVVVTFDCEGPDTTGGITGTVLSNPIAQLRTFLEQYVYRNRPALPWDTTPHPIIHATSWTALEAYFDRYGYESSVRIGGDRDKPKAMDAIQSVCDSYRWVGFAWLPDGTIGAGLVDWRDASPGSDWLRADVTTKPEEFKYVPGDRKEVFSHVSQPYMWSVAEQKFMASIAAHDIAAAPEPVWETVENRWSQGRFTQE